MTNFRKSSMNSAEKAGKVVATYLESQTLGMRVHERDGVCYIITPWWRADGNRIAVEVQFLNDEIVCFTDWGDTLSDAGKQWLTPDHTSLEAIQLIADRFKVKLSHDDFTLVSDGKGSIQLENLILAIVAVSGFIEPCRDPSKTNINQFSNAGASIVKMVEEIHRSNPEPEGYVPPPSDLAKNYKHYLYGFPKEE